RANSISLSAPGGGEGRGEVGDSGALADAHLTLPPPTAHARVRLSGGASPRRQGPLPPPPEGRRGASHRRSGMTKKERAAWAIRRKSSTRRRAGARRARVWRWRRSSARGVR